jgi:hypothetical protein
MADEKIAKKLSEVELKKALLELRIAEIERTRLQQGNKLNHNAGIAEEKIDRLKTLKLIYNQLENYLRFGNKQYSS